MLQDTQNKTEIADAIQVLVNTFSPVEIEELLFQIFQRYHLHSEGDKPEHTESILIIHNELRKIARSLHNNSEILKQLKNG